MTAILTPVDKLEARYTAALRGFLVTGGESGLEEAYELGRRALSEGLGVLEMSALYHQALESVLGGVGRSEDTAKLVRAGQSFFVESLSAFEITHRGFKEANVALRGLNQKLENEAKRIAHALHDEAGQLLASVYIALEEATADLPPDKRERFDYVKHLLDQIEGQLRRISHELRPTILDDLGLAPALEFLAEGVSARSKIPIAVESSVQERLPTQIETALYRTVQEALTNVTKHARATRVHVQLQREPSLLRCSISDDGVGFDPIAVLSNKERPSLGLIGIRERLEALKGTLALVSSPGQGTTLTLTIPMES